MKTLTFWQRFSFAARDLYFVIGCIVVVLLVLLAVLGPDLAPHNPFLVKPLQWFDGELEKAPFSPSKMYPLGTDDQGRDQLSLLLHGARTTLVMAFIAMMLRMLLGLFMGTFAGWWPGTFFDRAITAFTEFMASFPGLILAMLLVYAVGINRGQTAFIAALAIVGCGDVAQIMRGHVITIRNEQYIEAARAVGLSSLETLSRHVLPNLMGTLVALAALEMGSVLLLLGEMGFVHVFVGGGRMVFSEVAREAYHFFDVPDWGAMLGTSWRWFRSYPWFPLAPAMAFFISIVGFNLFGYGLQRFIERGRFHPSGWSVLRFLAVVALLLLGARALVMGAGVEAGFADMAREFNVERAMQDVKALSDPAMVDNPSLAAEYIAAEFEKTGLSRTTTAGTFVHPYTAIRGRITAPPELEALDAAGNMQLQFSDDLSYDPWQAFDTEESRENELVVVANISKVTESGILLMLDPWEKFRHSWSGRVPYEGILRVVPDDELAPPGQVPPFDMSSYGSVDRLPDFPNLLIGETAARELLEQAGLDLDDLREQAESGEVISLRTGLPIRVSSGLVYEEAEGVNVAGYIAGVDIESRGDRILVAATYQQGYPGADENASSVATLLEMARILQEAEFYPKRSIVFAAFDNGGGFRFANSPPMPTKRSNIWTTIVLDGIGVGESRLSRIGSGHGLAKAFDQSARRFGVRTKEMEDWQWFFVTNSSRLSWGDPHAMDPYQAVAVTRLGDELSGTPADTIERMDPEDLAKAAQAATHFVMVSSYR